MRVDIDKLEALEEKHRAAVEQWVPMFALDETEQDAIFELVREVRALRGIAEAAREQRAKVLAAPWRAPWDLVEPLDQALAEYDAGGTK